MPLRPFALAALLLLPVGTASADGFVQKLMTTNDKARIEAFDTTRKSAIDEARAGGSAADIAVLDKLLGPEPQSFQGFDLTGDWRCRTVKAGGLAELIVYGWFKCRVTDDGSGWMLTKLTGSQRTTGRFYDDGGCPFGLHHHQHGPRGTQKNLAQRENQRGRHWCRW